MTVDGVLQHHGDGDRPDATLVHRICVACVDTLAITGAAVSVMTTGGHRGVVAATDATSRRLEDVQFMLGDGPSVQAFLHGHSELVADVTRDLRWPAFGDATRELGVAAVFAIPLHLGAASLGALTLYRNEIGALGGPDLNRAIGLADVAAFALLDLLGGVSRGSGTGIDADSDGFGGASGSELFRSEVYQAAGMVVAQLGITIEAAMVRLRAYAFASGRPTSEIARDIVRRKLRLEADNVQPE